MTRRPDPNLTPDKVRQVLSYDAITGQFTWRVSKGLRVRAGGNAGFVAQGANTGYVIIGIDGRQYRAHRLAWFYVTGEWPPDEIDHINGNRADNRWANLRPATVAENQRNRAKSKRNTSGYKGVYWK